MLETITHTINKGVQAMKTNELQIWNHMFAYSETVSTLCGITMQAFCVRWAKIFLFRFVARFVSDDFCAKSSKWFFYCFIVYLFLYHRIKITYTEKMCGTGRFFSFLVKRSQFFSLGIIFDIDRKPEIKIVFMKKNIVKLP